MWGWVGFLVPFLMGLAAGLLAGARMLTLQQREYMEVIEDQQQFCRDVMSGYAKSIDLLRKVHEHGDQ